MAEKIITLTGAKNVELPLNTPIRIYSLWLDDSGNFERYEKVHSDVVVKEVIENKLVPAQILTGVSIEPVVKGTITLRVEEIGFNPFPAYELF